MAAEARERHQLARRLARADARRLAAYVLLATLALTAAAAALLQAASVEPAPGAAHMLDAPDGDGDGVPDVVENALLGSDPARAFATSLPESWIARHDLDASDLLLAERVAPYPRPPESPPVYGSEGLPEAFRMTLAEVYAYGRPETWNESKDLAWDSGLDPNAYDVGGSGVPYAWLIHHGLDPLDPDVLDTVPPGASVRWTPKEAYDRGFSPWTPDGDGDGLPDEDEEALGTSPLLFSTGGSGIADGWLVRHGFDPLDAAAPYFDADGDGLDNLREFQASLRFDRNATLQGGGLDPRRTSTAGGVVPDGWLVAYDLNPMEPGVEARVTEEHDDNGTRRVLTVADEYAVNRPPAWDETRSGPWMGGTDPNADDTDGDGLTDANEVFGWLMDADRGPKRVRSNPRVADTDADGLTDGQERHGLAGDVRFPPTDPSAPDSDFDGLLDGEEIGLLPWRGVTLPLLDPRRRDTDEDGLPDGEEAEYWLGRHAAYAEQGGDYEWGPPEDRPAPADLFGKTSSTSAGGLSLLLPAGDVDGDGQANAVDPDSDGDGLLDGWEVEPELYRESPYADEHGRSATDPANRDTDLDGLPDDWELKYGRFDEKIGGWNLDPALWSSFRDDTGDGERDLDDDGVTWYSYRRAAFGVVPTAREFRSTNAVEYEARSDPNKPSSSDDGILDGWKIFWGREYLLLPPEERGDLYPGAPGEFELPPDRPVPQIGSDDRIVFSTMTYRRYQPANVTTLLPGESGTVVTIRDAYGLERQLRVVQGASEHGTWSAFLNRTNPYVDDTDGDGVPDVWETVWSRLGPATQRLSPVLPDADADPDSDGLRNSEEWRLGTDPYAADSDFGGAGDDLERLLSLQAMDPADDKLALSDSRDADGDGVPDYQEVLGRANPFGTPTDPATPDTDVDGLLDGRSLSSVLRRTLRIDDPADLALLRDLEARGLLVHERPDGTADVLGELDVGSDPTSASTSGDGVPDGYAVLHGFAPTSPTGLGELYAHGRPSWWNESAHGVWRWGRAPGEPLSRDMDGDGLDDLNGEDPIPFANALNVLPQGDPREDGIDPLERLRRAQAYGAPAPSPLGPRAVPHVALDPLPDLVVANGSTTFSGSVTAGGVPVPNVTVILSLGDRSVAIGVAVTNATGAFRGGVLLAPALPAPEGSEGVVVFGALDGSGTHRNDPARLALLRTESSPPVFAWTYNVSPFTTWGQNASYPLPDGTPAWGLGGNASLPQRADLLLPSVIDVIAPTTAQLGETVAVNVTVRDALGEPAAGRHVRIGPGNLTLVLGPTGSAEAEFQMPDEPGNLTVLVEYAGDARRLPGNVTVRVDALASTWIDLRGPPGALRPGDTYAIQGRLLSSLGGVADARVTLAGNDTPSTTDEHGAFRFVRELPRDASPGELRVRALYAGNETLTSSASNLTLEVTGAPRCVASAVRARSGGDALLQVRLASASGDGLAAREVTLVDASARTRVAITDSSGVASFNLSLRDLPPQEASLPFRFDGGADGVCEGAATLVVVGEPSLVASLTSRTRGTDARVEATLADPVGRPLGGAALRVELGGQARRAVTAADGTLSLPWPLDALTRAGPTTLRVSYAGSADGLLLPNATALPVVLRDAPRVTLVDERILAQEGRLDGTLATLVGEPLARHEVQVDLPWATLSALTDDRGAFALPVPVPPTTPLGPTAATLRVPGRQLLDGLEEARTLQLRDRARLLADVPIAAVQGGVLEVPVRLVDSRGLDVPAFNVTASLDGVPLREEAPSAGKVRVRVPADALPGPRRLQLVASSTTVEAPPLEAQLLVQVPTFLESASAIELGAGRSGSLDVLVRNGSSPLAGARLLVRGLGGVDVEISTDHEGRAQVPLPPAGPASTELQVLYVGNSTQAPAAFSVRLQPVPVPHASGGDSWTRAAIAALALACVVAIVWIATRRARAPPAVARRAARRLLRDTPDFRGLHALYAALLRLAGVAEDQEETLTFGQVLRRFSGRVPDEDLTLIQETFDAAVYAPHLLGRDALTRCAAALDRLATAMERPDAPAPQGGAPA